MEDKMHDHQRLKAISQIIRSTDKSIKSPREILDKLKDNKITFEMVVSDLQRLKVKVIEDGYFLSDRNYKKIEEESYKNIMSWSGSTIKSVNRYVIVETRPGMAQATATAIELCNLENIICIVAGDDTIFLMGKDKCSANNASEKLEELINRDSINDINQVINESTITKYIDNNIIIIKTHPGMAQAAAMAIDAADICGIIASLARYDSIIIFIDKKSNAQDIVKNLQKNPLSNEHKEIKLENRKYNYNLVIHELLIDEQDVDNLVIVKTHSGSAHAVAAAIEKAKIDGIIASIAGDDTIMIVGNSPEDAVKIKKQLKEIRESY